MMMLRLSSVGILVLAAATAWGEGEGVTGKQSISLEAISSLGVGETAYEISATEMGTSIRSRLEFPLDGVYVGASGRVNTDWRLMGVKNVSFGAKFLTNVTDPSEDMNDFDWLNGMLVGDTASDTEASSYIVDLSMKGDLVNQPNLIVRGVGGLRHEKYDFEIYGFSGYYLPPLGDGPVSMDNDILALTYEMTHNWIYGGIEGEIIMTESLRARGGMVVGIGAISDRDDHVLRDKISEADLVSFSTKFDAHMIWYLASATASCRPYIKVGLEAMAMMAEGEQDQVFEDGTGIVFLGIDDEIEMTFATADAIVGCDF